MYLLNTSAGWSKRKNLFLQDLSSSSGFYIPLKHILQIPRIRTTVTAITVDCKISMFSEKIPAFMSLFGALACAN